MSRDGYSWGLKKTIGTRRFPRGAGSAASSVAEAHPAVIGGSDDQGLVELSGRFQGCRGVDQNSPPPSPVAMQAVTWSFTGVGIAPAMEQLADRAAVRLAERSRSRSAELMSLPCQIRQQPPTYYLGGSMLWRPKQHVGG